MLATPRTNFRIQRLSCGSSRPGVSFRRHAGSGAGGFTLLELLVVMAIITILASIIAPKAPQMVARARDARVMEDLANLRVAVTSYFGANAGRYPESLNDLVPEFISRAASSWRGSGGSGSIEYEPDTGRVYLKVSQTQEGSTGTDTRGISYEEY